MGKPRGNAENIESIITRTVRETIEAYRASSSRSVKDAFKATERRLYALPDLREKLEDDPADPKFIVTRRGQGYLLEN